MLIYPAGCIACPGPSNVSFTTAGPICKHPTIWGLLVNQGREDSVLGNPSVIAAPTWQPLRRLDSPLRSYLGPHSRVCVGALFEGAQQSRLLQAGECPHGSLGHLSFEHLPTLRALPGSKTASKGARRPARLEFFFPRSSPLPLLLRHLYSYLVVCLEDIADMRPGALHLSAPPVAWFCPT